MVLARLLTDAGKLAITCGRVGIGITLVEDLAEIRMAATTADRRTLHGFTLD